ncbi:hypothetical protein A2Y85_02840 [candidate division WOR-3 bacterium RBG_13_43_14]|uniref:Uncharacterized protein n=1 Tax=candidate division WOR-3 bacterium RBG_13_43_14 TaxID=1802590 RepID=A0A1F4UA00_UNCW3|nr:MAG: hypothetical protein A2Y85_02840 [candidate division WOR-3 bacterium RBG_13_43_14]
MIILFFASIEMCFSYNGDIQDSLDIVLFEAMECYYNGYYSQTISVLQKALDSYQNGDRLSAHKFIAFSYMATGNFYAARIHFKEMLDIDPTFMLDSITVPLDVYRTFISAKQELRGEAAMCSCFIPGWGQMMVGEEKKGRTIMITSAITAGCGAISWIITDDKHRQYLSLGPDERHRMDELYRNYNTWYHISVGVTAGFIICYVYSIADALPRFIGKNKKEKSYHLRIGYEHIEFGYQVGLDK